MTLKRLREPNTRRIAKWAREDTLQTKKWIESKTGEANVQLKIEGEEDLNNRVDIAAQNFLVQIIQSFVKICIETSGSSL